MPLGQVNDMVPFSFARQEWLLTRSGAVYWPNEGALLVADLHLEKASFFARTGQMLPPYDSRETLERVALAIKDTGARRVYTLGDNFHDEEGADRLEPHAAGMLDALTRAVDWVWITGNHDGRTSQIRGGAVAVELQTGGVILRHRANPGETRPELSGHFHPRLRINARGRRINRPCAVLGQDQLGNDRMILPAFGALTGGMDAGDRAIIDALQPSDTIHALVEARQRLLRFPLWRAAA